MAEELIDNIDGLEISEHELHVLNMYVRLLAEPQRDKSLPKRERTEGLHIYNDVGCNGCHTVSMTTGPHEIEALNEVDIAPHSDFLLHDMGAGLAEGCKGDARPWEWRTEPLWGLRFVERYLHDGRAESVADAIKQHALSDPECPVDPENIVSTSEATGSVKAYCALSAEDKTKLINYLNTL